MEVCGNTISVKANGQTFLPSDDCQAAKKAGIFLGRISDSRNPKHLIASTHSLGGKHGYKSDEMFRTTDGGKSWKPIFKTGYEYDYSKAPYTKVAPLHWMFDIEIDPTDAEHAMFTTGFGGWETFQPLCRGTWGTGEMEYHVCRYRRDRASRTLCSRKRGASDFRYR